MLGWSLGRVPIWDRPTFNSEAESKSEVVDQKHCILRLGVMLQDKAFGWNWRWRRWMFFERKAVSWCRYELGRGWRTGFIWEGAAAAWWDVADAGLILKVLAVCWFILQCELMWLWINWQMSLNTWCHCGPGMHQLFGEVPVVACLEC